ncbi:hypothetical protein HRbin19_00355 [bacterium HR19]|nr:hypothetical protein HRbin19_00355 [bacterium HR19]
MKKVISFSLVITIIISLLVSQIELLEAIDRGNKKINDIFFLSLLAYIPDIFFLSIPISFFRFFATESKRFSSLITFGMSPIKFFFSVFLLNLAVISPAIMIFSGLVSPKAKEKLEARKTKEKREYAEVFIEKKDKSAYLIYIKKENTPKGEKVKMIKISREGEIIEKSEEENLKPFISANLVGNQSKVEVLKKEKFTENLFENPAKFVLTSVLIPLICAFGGFIGWKMKWKGLIPILIVISLSLMICFSV